MIPAEEPEGGYFVPPLWLLDAHETLLGSARFRERWPAPPLSRAMRLRRRVNIQRGWLAYKAFRLIAGYEVPESDD